MLERTIPIELQREALRLLIQSVIELEVSHWLEASPHERNQNRRAYRNGYRQRAWRSSLGEIRLFIPKVRKGSYYPLLLDSIDRAEEDLLGLVDTAFQKGHVTLGEVSTTLRKLGIESPEPHHLADIADLLHDLVERSRERLDGKITSSKPTAALATQYLDFDPSIDRPAPLALLSNRVSDTPTDDGIELLWRVRQALLHELDAVAA